MSVETSVYTRQPAMSGSQLRELAGRQGLELRFLEFAGTPLEPDVRLDEPMYSQDYVLIGWPADDAETTEGVEGALKEGAKPEVDRLGMSGKLGWCSIHCREFDFAEYEASLREDLDYEDEEDKEPVPAELLERMRWVKTQYSFRSGTRPKQCADLLGKVAELIRDATDGFVDE
jgi:hypothetical protein